MGFALKDDSSCLRSVRDLPALKFLRIMHSFCAMICILLELFIQEHKQKSKASLLTKFLRLGTPREHFKNGRSHDITSRPQASHS